jgi:hypothetical protein
MLLLAAVLHTEQPCFDETANRDLPFAVFQQSPAPAVHQAGYRYYPLTAAASMDLGSLNRSRAGIGLYYFLWANRCHDLGSNAGVCGWNKKGNLVFPRLTNATGEVRTFFTGFGKANDCTLAQAAQVLGDSAAAAAYGKRAGLAMVTKGPDALAHASNNRLVDVCLLETESLKPEGKGIVLDYEVQDGRTPEATLAFLREFTSLVHRNGRAAILLTNPLDAPTQRYTGMAASIAHQAYESFDRTLIMLWHNNRQKDLAASAKFQLDMLRAGGPVEGKRLLALFELNHTTMAETETARALIQAEHMAGVMFWRNYAEMGGPCDSNANRKIACLVFGRCGN